MEEETLETYESEQEVEPDACDLDYEQLKQE